MSDDPDEKTIEAAWRYFVADMVRRGRCAPIGGAKIAFVAGYIACLKDQRRDEK